METNDIIVLKNKIDDEFNLNNCQNESEKEDTSICNISISNSRTNVVSGDILRNIQKSTLDELKKFLSKTFGPMGSNTKIITGNNKDNITSAYSKDGLKVLKNISNAGPIEMSIIEEILDVTRHVEKEVGDGTTSTVILSSIIFDKLINIQKKYNIPPYQLIKKFNKEVENIKKEIKLNKQTCTVDDIYDISMISTNSDEEVSNNIMEIYKEYGMDVDLSVGISNDVNTVIKVYDGLTITEGMSDPVYITNATNGTSEIHNASVYHFADPIDTMEMIALFESILEHNIYDPYRNDEEPIPTVVVCPRISKDMSATLKGLAEMLYQFDTKGAQSAKPPILIITNVVASDEIIMDDIATLCGCKTIRKYIDPNVLKKDQESGKAPTVKNVYEFGGKTELVIADAKKTKFINPSHMHVYKEDGTMEDDPIYIAMINFLETEIANVKGTETAAEIGILKKRLSALKANLVEYLVGGVTVSERDSKKDLIEDAIKNCSSAAKYGMGYAANFEALQASFNNYNNNDFNDDPIVGDIKKCIFSAYYDISKVLYSTVCSDDIKVTQAVAQSIINKCPYNISSGELPNLKSLDGIDVKCSIMLDINILNTVSKIITIMVTCNQCLLQAPQLNTY